MIIIRKNAGLLYTVDFEKCLLEDEILDRSPPLNALYQKHQHVLPTQYSNIAISMMNENYFINVYSRSLKKWEQIEIESLDDSQKKLLEPFLKNIYHQVWQLREDYNDLNGVNYSFRGGNLGNFHQLHIDLNKTMAKLDDDVECLYSSDLETKGLADGKDVCIGRESLLEEAIPTEFLKYQKPTNDSKKPVFALSHHC